MINLVVFDFFNYNVIIKKNKEHYNLIKYYKIFYGNTHKCFKK